MAGSLDDTLREILKAASISGKYGDTHEATYQELTAQIKAAFADEGYYKPQVFSENAGDFTDATGGYTNPLMTGQEWYQAYEREKGQGSLDNLKDFATREYSDGVDHAVIKCDEAAKRAAGLEPQL